MKQRIWFLFLLFAGCALIMALLKLPFLALYVSSGDYAAADWWQVIRHGWSLDRTVAGYVTALPWLLMLLTLFLPLREKFLHRLMALYLAVVGLFATAVYAVDLGLYGYWGYRIDSSVLLYLKSPREAVASLTASDWVLGVAALLCLGALFVAFGRWLLRRLRLPELSRLSRVVGCLVMLFVGGLCFLAIRGGMSVAVANVSKVYFSPDQLLNHAATNPLFSLLSTIGDDEELRPQYLFYEEPERAARFEELRGDRPDTVAYPRLLRQTRPNVVLVILESFGRTFMEAEWEGEAVMPHLKRYRDQGIWFENFFANSFRTDRGEVAVMNGYPAQTRTSIMKHPAKSRSLPSVARSLARAGYSTWFAYGGDLNFTDQASYMYATGWERLTWQKDLDFEAPTSKWGYADDVMGDYFTREVLRLDSLSRTEGRPFLAGWLTLSSHEPFDVPYAKFDHKILNAVAFTDEMVGRMLDVWRSSPAWENLLVVLVPDHAYPYPDGIAYNVPLRHRIPMVWTGGAVKQPEVVEHYASQIDLAATLLAQLELPHDDFLFSKNILSPEVPHFAYWTFNEGFGVADASGATIYDCTSSRVLSDDDPHSGRLERGKVLLQTTYKDLHER